MIKIMIKLKKRINRILHSICTILWFEKSMLLLVLAPLLAITIILYKQDATSNIKLCTEIPISALTFEQKEGILDRQFSIQQDLIIPHVSVELKQYAVENDLKFIAFPRRQMKRAYFDRCCDIHNWLMFKTHDSVEKDVIYIYTIPASYYYSNFDP
jgi:hypothetical protein